MSDHDTETFNPSHYRTNRSPMTRAERAAYDALMRRPAPSDEVLLDEAFALAGRDLEDCPVDRGRLRRARQHLLCARYGVPSLILADDLWFAGVLITRVLESLGLDEMEMVALFDAVGLPVDVVPHYQAVSELRTADGAALGAIASDLAALRSTALCPDLRETAHDCSACRELEADLEDLDAEAPESCDDDWLDVWRND